MGWSAERQREYMREYQSRPDVRARKRAYNRAYRAIPKNREKHNKQSGAYQKTRRAKAKATDPAGYRNERRRSNLLHFYGLTVQEYDAMMAEQNGVCAVCSMPEMSRVAGRGADERRRLAVDHDHESGRVRGLLCLTCNHGLGAFRENPELLRDAATYLEEHKTKEGK